MSTIALPPPGEVITLDDGSRLMSRPRSGGLGELEAVHLPPAGKPGDHVQVWGEAHIRNGPGKCSVPGCGCGQVHIVARNKITGQGLRHIMNMAFLGWDDTSGDVDLNPFSTNVLTESYIRIGTGGSGTTNGTTSLTTVIAVNPTSTAGGTLGVDSIGSTTSPYRYSFTATWNAGTLSAALGATAVTEIGVFGRLATSWGSRGTGSNGNLTNLALFARLSSADTEFTSFTVNHAAPLVIEYRATATFT